MADNSSLIPSSDDPSPIARLSDDLLDNILTRAGPWHAPKPRLLLAASLGRFSLVSKTWMRVSSKRVRILSIDASTSLCEPPRDLDNVLRRFESTTWVIVGATTPWSVREILEALHRHYPKLKSLDFCQPVGVSDDVEDPLLPLAFKHLEKVSIMWSSNSNGAEVVCRSLTGGASALRELALLGVPSASGGAPAALLSSLPHLEHLYVQQPIEDIFADLCIYDTTPPLVLEKLTKLQVNSAHLPPIEQTFQMFPNLRLFSVELVGAISPEAIRKLVVRMEGRVDCCCCFYPGACSEMSSLQLREAHQARVTIKAVIESMTNETRLLLLVLHGFQKVPRDEDGQHLLGRLLTTHLLRIPNFRPLTADGLKDFRKRFGLVANNGGQEPLRRRTAGKTLSM